MARTLAVHEKRQVLEVKSDARAKFFCSIRHFHISHDAPYLPPKFCMTFVFYFPEYYRNLAMIWVKTGEVWDHSNWTLNNALGLAPYSSCREILVTNFKTEKWNELVTGILCTYQWFAQGWGVGWWWRGATHGNWTHWTHWHPEHAKGGKFDSAAILESGGPGNEG